MKKLFLFSLIYFLFSISIIFGQTIEFEYKLPDFVLKKEFLYGTTPFNARIDFKISNNFKKVVVMTGYYNSFDEMESSNIELKDLNRLKHKLKKKNKIWLSRVLFLDEENQIIKERVFPYYCIIDLVDYSQNPVIAITKLIHHGNYMEQIKTDFYDLNGNFLKSFDLKDKQELYLFKSKDNNYYYFASYIDVDLAGYFEIYPVKNLFGSLKNKNDNERYIINFKNGSPSAFMLLGGEEVKAVFAKGATIKMIGLKNREDFWKIENIGANITNIHLNDKNQLEIRAYKTYFLIDPETGEIQTQFNIKKIPFIYNFLRKNKTRATSFYLEKGNLHIKTFAKRYEFVIKDINSSDKQKTIELYSRKQTLKLPEKKVIREKNNRIYYVFIENGELKILSQSKNNAYIKKKIAETTIPSTQLSIE